MHPFARRSSYSLLFFGASTRIPIASSSSQMGGAPGRWASIGAPCCRPTSNASPRARQPTTSLVRSIAPSRTSRTTSGLATSPPVERRRTPSRRPPFGGPRARAAGDSGCPPGRLALRTRLPLGELVSERRGLPRRSRSTIYRRGEVGELPHVAAALVRTPLPITGPAGNSRSGARPPPSPLAGQTRACDHR